MQESEPSGRKACDNLNGVTGERAWNHGPWQCETHGFKINSVVAVGLAPWLDVGGEGEREIKDETPLSKQACLVGYTLSCSTQGGHSLGKKMLKLLL